MILLIFLLTLAIGLLAQWHVKCAYARHSRTPIHSGYTGVEAAHEILRQQVERRKTRQQLPHKGHRQHPLTNSRWSGALVAARV